MRLSIAIPSSLTEDASDPRARTLKVGAVGRAASIFGVREIRLFPDPSFNDTRFIEKLLQYQECPPYLRKRLFGIAPELEFAGLLPPLNTPTHLVIRDARKGELREGLAVHGGIEIGADRLAEAEAPIPVGERRTVRVTSIGRNLTVEPAPNPPDEYDPGYRVRRCESLREALSGFDLTIATSRTGGPIETVPALSKEARVGLAFGSARKGLRDFVAQEGGTDPFDVWVNTFPGQGTRTVRTEEAILVSLAVVRGHANVK